MKQKRIYKVKNIEEDGNTNCSIYVLHILRQHCIDLAESSDRAFPLKEARLTGFIGAMNIYEPGTFFWEAERCEHATLVQITTLDSRTVISVLSQREDTNE